MTRDAPRLCPSPVAGAGAPVVRAWTCSSETWVECTVSLQVCQSWVSVVCRDTLSVCHLPSLSRQRDLGISLAFDFDRMKEKRKSQRRKSLEESVLGLGEAVHLVSQKWAQLLLETSTGIAGRSDVQAHLAHGQAQVTASYTVTFSPGVFHRERIKWQ